MPIDPQSRPENYEHFLQALQRGKDYSASNWLTTYLEEAKTPQVFNEPVDSSGRTVLQIAASKNMVQTVQKLCTMSDTCIALNLQTRGMTALMMACHFGSLDAGLELVRHRYLDVSLTDHGRNTALDILLYRILSNARPSQYPTVPAVHTEQEAFHSQVQDDDTSLNYAPAAIHVSQEAKANKLIRLILYRFLSLARKASNRHLLGRYESLKFLLKAETLRNLSIYWSRNSPDFQGHLPFTHEPQCYMCKKQFSMLNRRHHCRGCGNAVCSTDSRQISLDHSLPYILYCKCCW